MRSAKTFTKTSFLKVSNTTWTLSVETVVIVEKIKMATPSVMMPIVATRSVMTKNAPSLKLEIVVNRQPKWMKLTNDTLVTV